MSHINRRVWLQVGTLGTLTHRVGWSSPRVLAGEGAAPKPGAGGTARACILLWLDGGPSHLETFDLKPDAPAEVRGPFRPIATAVPGIEICEHLPRTARVAGRLSLIRSLTSPLGEHGLANQYLQTGYKPSAVLRYPSYGAVLSRLRPGPGALPGHIAIPEGRGAGAGFLGARHEAFATGGDPARGDFRVRDLELYPLVDVRRLERRREFLREFDAVQQSWESAAAEGQSDLDRALQLSTSVAAKQAFDLSGEPAEVRERYGPRTFGQSCLLSRRLIERGVNFVTVLHPGWDTHSGLTLQLRDGYSGARTGVGLLPTFDLGFSALVEDLAERGLLDETLVLAVGEFGRTPKINTQGGRDHWPRVFSLVAAGGGIPQGEVYGASDRVGESPADSPVTPADLACSIYHRLGIDPATELRTAEGRPIAVNQGGAVIPGW